MDRAGKRRPSFPQHMSQLGGHSGPPDPMTAPPLQQSLQGMQTSLPPLPTQPQTQQPSSSSPPPPPPSMPVPMPVPMPIPVGAHQGYATGGRSPLSSTGSLGSLVGSGSPMLPVGSPVPSNLRYGQQPSLNSHPQPSQPQQVYASSYGLPPDMSQTGQPPLKRERPSEPSPQQQQQMLNTMASQTSMYDLESVDVLKKKLAPTWFEKFSDGEKLDINVLQHQKSQILRVVAECRVKEEEMANELKTLKRENRQKDALLQASGGMWNKVDGLFDAMLEDLAEDKDESKLKTALETYKEDYVEQLLGAPFSFSKNPGDEDADNKKVEELLQVRFEKTKKVLTGIRNMVIANRLMYTALAGQIRNTNGNSEGLKQMVEKDNENLHNQLEKIQKLLDEKDIRVRTVLSQKSELDELLRAQHNELEELRAENEDLREKAEKAKVQMCRKLSRDALTLTSTSPSSSFLTNPIPSAVPSPMITATSPAPVTPTGSFSAIAPKKMMLMQQQIHQQQQSPFGAIPAVLQQSEHMQPILAEYERLKREQQDRIKTLESRLKEVQERSQHLQDKLEDSERKASDEKARQDNEIRRQREEAAAACRRLDEFTLASSSHYDRIEMELNSMKNGIGILERLVVSSQAEQIPQESAASSDGSKPVAENGEVVALRAEVKRLQSRIELLKDKAAMHCPVTVKAASNALSSQSAVAPTNLESTQVMSSSLPGSVSSGSLEGAVAGTQTEMGDGDGESQVVTKELCAVINEELDKLRKSSDEIVVSLKNQIEHLSADKPESDESAMIEEIGSIGTVCEQLQQQNTNLTQQLTNQYDQYSKLSREKIAMELRLKELEKDLTQSRQDRDDARRALDHQVQLNLQNVEQLASLSRSLNEEKQESLSFTTRVNQANIGRETAENEVTRLNAELQEVRSLLETKSAELARAQSEKDSYEKEVEREVAGLTRIYKSKLKYALGLLSATGNPTATGKSRLKKSPSGVSTSSLSIRPEFKDLLPDDEIENFEVSGRNMAGSGDGDSMVEDDLDSLYRDRVICSVCGERPRKCVLKRCAHTFCEQCIDKCLRSRNRKCPNCHNPFGDADIIKIIL